MEFAESVLVWIHVAVFNVGDFVNHHNCHYWASKETNPEFTVEKLQARPSVIVCCIDNSRLIGPYILHDTMNGERYINMLKNVVLPVISIWNDAGVVHFMQDGELPHFAIRWK